MPKNKGKGGKNRKRGKEADDERHELVFKQDGQEYAQVSRMLGNERCEALLCVDGTRRLCHIRGKMHNKAWVAEGDVVFVSLQDDKANVILKYMPDTQGTPAQSEIPDTVGLNEEENVDEDDIADYVQFRDEDIVDKI